MHTKNPIFISTLLLVSSLTFADLDIRTTVFGKSPADQDVTLYILSNSKMKVGVIDYGATLISIITPDKDGGLDDVLLGFDTIEGYFGQNFGSVTGRYANRIAGAKFTIDGTEHSITANAGKNHIHGGRTGFNKVMWTGKKVKTDDYIGVELTYLSKDGEEGFPGNLNCTVTYTLNDNNELKLHYRATTDKPTVVNLTNHAYFNLAGAGNGDILDHVATINASKYTPADDALIPTGGIEPVENTPLDFTKPQKVGSRIDQLAQTRGYDHNYVFGRPAGTLHHAANIYDPSTSRMMDVLTTQPGMQFYTANHLNNLKGRGSKLYNRHYGFCCETQHYPDSPNKPNFPTTILRPGEEFDSTTIFRFSVRPSGNSN